jgi:hypothetical protein
VLCEEKVYFVGSVLILNGRMYSVILGLGPEGVKVLEILW